MCGGKVVVVEFTQKRYEEIKRLIAVPKHPRTAKEKQEARRRKRWRLEWLMLRGARKRPGKIVTLQDKRRAARLQKVQSAP